jgi:hypothetical protein
MKRFMAMVIVFGLAACAPTVDGTELGGVAQWYGTSPGPAIQAANEHCQKYGRTARPTQTNAYSGTLTFSCEKT